MADPIIPRGIRTQLIFQGRSGLPEDRFVNTFAFRRSEGESMEVASATITGYMQQLVTNATQSGDSLEIFLSPAVKRGTDAVEVRCYDLGEAPPRQPVIGSFPLQGSPPATGLPAEVAICGSFYSERNIPKSRGRIYFGPLATLGSNTSSTNGRVNPGISLQTCLAQALDRLKLGGQLGDPVWCILSGRDAALKPVTDGWVDDAYDTQRRRGEAPTGRITWGTALP